MVQEILHVVDLNKIKCVTCFVKNFEYRAELFNILTIFILFPGENIFLVIKILKLRVFLRVKSTVKNELTNHPLEELYDRGWEGEGAGVPEDVLGGQLVLDHELGEVSNNLRTGRNLYKHN